MSLQELREQILAASLPQLAFEGVTDKALRRGALDAGLPVDSVSRAFPGGIAEMIRFWSQTSDRRMLAAVQALDPRPQRLRERIAAAVRLRLEGDAEEREAVRRAASWLALPWNAALALACAWETVNAIWYAAGDTATDFSWYSKRATLMAVYGATLLCWLNDDSDNRAATWAFLDRRIDDAMTVTDVRAHFATRLGRRPHWRRSRSQP